MITLCTKAEPFLMMLTSFLCLSLFKQYKWRINETNKIVTGFDSKISYDAFLFGRQQSIRQWACMKSKIIRFLHLHVYYCILFPFIYFLYFQSINEEIQYAWIAIGIFVLFLCSKDTGTTISYYLFLMTYMGNV